MKKLALYPRSGPIRLAIVKARRITSMLQGTMAFEGQALDRQQLRTLHRQSVNDFLRQAGRSRSVLRRLAEQLNL